MNHIEALDLALEALELNNLEWKSLADSGDAGFWSAEEQEHYKQTEAAITAIKQARALDKMAENARELGLDYEPVGEAYLCDKCQTPFDGAWECPNCGHRSATKESVYTTPPAAQPAPVQDQWLQAVTDKIEAKLLSHRLSFHDEANDAGTGYPLVDALCCGQADLEIGRQEVKAIAEVVFHVLAANTPPAQREWVGLTQEEIENCYGGEIDDFARAIEAKLKEKNT